AHRARRARCRRYRLRHRQPAGRRRSAVRSRHVERGSGKLVDILSILGLFLALVAILAGAVLKGAGLHALISAAAFMIVFVGTLAAIFVQTPWHVMRHAMRIFPWVMKPPPLDGQQLI